MNLESDKGRVQQLPSIGTLIRLAAALDVPPVLLLYPNAPDGRVEALPGAYCTSDTAVQWFAGEASPPQKPRADGVIHIEPSSDGVKVMTAIRKRRTLNRRLPSLFDGFDQDGDELSSETRRAVQEWREEVARLNAEIRQLGGTVDDG